MAAQGRYSRRKRRWLIATIALTAIIWVALIVADRIAKHNINDVKNTFVLSGTPRPAIHTTGKQVVGASISQPPAKGRKVVRVSFKYGSGENEMGMVRPEGQTPIGPESFALGQDGQVLIADRANKRLLVCSAQGTVQTSIRIPDSSLNDIFTDAGGQFYVYDQVRRVLQQFDVSGSPKSELRLNPGDIETRGYFHAVGSSVYFANTASEDVLIGTLQDGALTEPDKSTERRFDGVHGRSGKLYSVRVDRDVGLRIHVNGSPSGAGFSTIDLPVQGILAARFAGDENNGRVHVQTERMVNGTVTLEVMVFGPDGNLAETTTLPENDYSIWTTKLVDVADNGTIVQFLPGENHASLSLFFE